MIQTVRNNGITDISVLIAEDGKDLYCKFHQKNVGKEAWLGYVYYDHEGNKLETPHLETPDDYTEIDEEIPVDPSVENPGE